MSRADLSSATSDAASALGAVVMVRNLIACVFPLFSDRKAATLIGSLLLADVASPAEMFAKVHLRPASALCTTIADPSFVPTAREPMGDLSHRIPRVLPRPHPLLPVLPRQDCPVQLAVLPRALRR